MDDDIRAKNIWRTLRTNKGKPLSLAEIMAMSDVGGARITKLFTTDYLSALHAARYIRRKGQKPRVFWLVNDSGPRAPAFARVPELFDPNTGINRVTWRKAPEGWS